jgi:hypothetical protein
VPSRDTRATGRTGECGAGGEQRTKTEDMRKSRGRGHVHTQSHDRMTQFDCQQIYWHGWPFLHVSSWRLLNAGRLRRAADESRHDVRRYFSCCQLIASDGRLRPASCRSSFTSSSFWQLGTWHCYRFFIF